MSLRPSLVLCVHQSRLFRVFTAFSRRTNDGTFSSVVAMPLQRRAKASTTPRESLRRKFSPCYLAAKFVKKSAKFGCSS